MATPQTAGSWLSPITTSELTKSNVMISQVITDGSDVYWLECRPEEKGRNVIVKHSADGNHRDMTPPPWNVRSKAHEYGGRCYDVHNGIIYFSSFSDQNIYYLDSQASSPEIRALTKTKNCYYADHRIDAEGKWLLCVSEQDFPEFKEPKASIMAFNLEDQSQYELVSGADFYSNPMLSPDGKQLCWLCWQHPNMPWDTTELWIADIETQGGRLFLSQPQRLVTTEQPESIFQPRWGQDNQLYYVSDRSNWWNLYCYTPGTEQHECVIEADAEYGLPLWQFGMSTFDLVDTNTLAACFTQNNRWQLALINLESRQQTIVESHWDYFTNIACDSAGHIFCFVGNATEAVRLQRFTLNGPSDTIKCSSDSPIDSGYLSQPQTITYPTSNNDEAYGLFYPPCNRDFAVPNGERPPLIVMAHGGPTACSEATFNLKVQYWTSRGFAVFEVNYRGSTGYGRTYRDKLKPWWGIRDVDDAVYGVKYLAEQGLVDADKVAIRGGSAGGYTVLCALTFHNTFKAGTSLYGIGDLNTLLSDTHKFESRYLDSLIGPYPEYADRYKERSPINYAEQLSCPTLFLQGLDDKVVPPNQAETMVNALRTQNTPVAYLAFEGEGHGFRQAATLQRSLEAELSFYCQIFGFEPADDIEPLTVDNL